MVDSGIDVLIYVIEVIGVIDYDWLEIFDGEVLFYEG